MINKDVFYFHQSKEFFAFRSSSSVCSVFFFFERMENTKDFIKRATDYLTKAVNCENNGKLEDALMHYEKALDIFKHVLNNKNNIGLNEKIAPKINAYIEKASQLRETIKENPHGTRNSSLSPSSKKSTGNKNILCDNDSENNYGEEMQQLMNQMARTQIATLNVTLDDIIGLNETKTLLKQIIFMPRDMPQLFTGNRSPPRSILLYGPGGTGKTLVGKALATVSQLPFFAVSYSDIVSKWQGESERGVKALFEMLKTKAPVILFIDEVDSLCSKRTNNSGGGNSKTLQEFLIQLDGISGSNSNTEKERVLFIGCTNIPWDLDMAMRRRFQRRVYIPLPDERTRKEMFQYFMKNNSHTITNEQFDKLAKMTESYSGDDICQMTKNAVMIPVNMIATATHFETFVLDDKKWYRPCSYSNPYAVETTWDKIEDKTAIDAIPVSYLHFLEAYKIVKPSNDVKDMKRYEEWTKEFGSDGA
jgi:vacuolar protein-sorting-associated protein 4